MAQTKRRKTTAQKRETATTRVSQRSRQKRKNDNRIMILLIIGVVAIFSTVLVTNIYSAKQKLAELREQETKLEAQYNEQLKQAEELKEKEKYVKTNAYIEEQARKHGLVYPDEVIFKPEE